MNEELVELLNRCKLSFNAQETAEVMAFIQVNENKLALETICAIFFEVKKEVSQEQLALIKKLGQQMTISPSKWERLTNKIE
jgi:hypothetical protein